MQEYEYHPDKYDDLEDQQTSRRVAITNNPLAKPVLPIHRLAARVQDLYYMPDPSPLYVALGVLAGNMLAGMPLWMMMAGPSGCGKTTCIRALKEITGVVDIGSVSGAAAFLSGVPNREKEKGATGGMLNEIGHRGLMLMEDFTTSVMNRQRDEKQEIIDTLRLVYNGEYSRDVGSGGAKRLKWWGKVGLLAGGTNEIDRQSSDANALGERWIYYRFPYSDGKGETRKMMRDKQPGVSKAMLREMVGGFVKEIGLGWGDGHEENDEPRRDLGDREEVRISAMAELVAKARSSPKRDGRTGEIVDLLDIEVQTRMAGELAQLYLGLERIGLSEVERWPIIGKVARDSMPRIKSGMIWGVREENQKVSLNRVAKNYMGGCGKTTAERCAEDLAMVGVLDWNKAGRVENREKVEKEDGGSSNELQGGRAKGYVEVNVWTKRLMELGWGIK